MNSYILKPIGFIRSTVKGREDALRQRKVRPTSGSTLNGSLRKHCWEWKRGHELLILITWLHQANRDVLKGHPQGNPITGVFYTRSPARPNPLGLHPVTVRAIEGTRLRVGPVEAFDGTPVVDIKSASTRTNE